MLKNIHHRSVLRGTAFGKAYEVMRGYPCFHAGQYNRAVSTEEWKVYVTSHNYSTKAKHHSAAPSQPLSMNSEAPPLVNYFPI